MITTQATPTASTATDKRFLHVGCGPQTQAQTTPGFNADGWSEIRLDINPAVKPDVVASMTDMSALEDGSMDGLFSSHNIEHLYAHEVTVALAEFARVLNDDGFAIITCPDIESVAALIMQGKLVEAVYDSPAGPITPLDIMYGHRPSLAAGNTHMAHRCGFTQDVLRATLVQSGFATAATMARQRAPHFDLWAVASKRERSDQEMQALAAAHFPTD